MKRNEMLFGVVTLSTVCVILLIWLYFHTRSLPVATPDNGDAKPNMVATPPPAQVQQRMSGPSRKLPVGETKIIEDGFAQSQKDYWDKLMSTPISFYGRVVDESGKSISMANIHYSFDDHVGGGHTNGDIVADDTGCFHLSGHGLAIVIIASKSGYYAPSASAGGLFGYDEAGGPMDKHTNPATPAMFTLRAVGKLEPLIKVGHYFTILKDGTPERVDLATGKVIQSSDQAIQVEAWTNDINHRANDNTPYDWHCRVSIPGGGLLERADSYAFQAPEFGYRPSDEIDMPAALGGAWRGQVTKNYFVKLASNNYARLVFTMTAAGEHFFTIESYLNPSGSRNLEAGQPAPGASP